MKYANLTIRQMQSVAHEIAVKHGFWPLGSVEDRNVGEAIALMHSELSEALEYYRANGVKPGYFETIQVESGTPPKPSGMGEEFADVIIRIMDFCEGRRIPLETYLAAKLEYNESRPYRHGGKRA